MIVEFIIPTYNRINELHSMLASLIAQTNSNWLATIVVDDVENDIVKLLVSKFDTDKIRYIFTGVRYNDWGHTPRQIGKQQATGDYIIMTGDDNYYVPVFVDELLKVATENPGLIYWDMVHNHYDYSYFKCSPYVNHVDMGAFATRRDIAQEIVLDTCYASDGYFVRSVCEKYPNEKTVKIEKILFVHN